MRHTIVDASQLELNEKVVDIKRVTKVVKGGRNFRFSALVVVGDGRNDIEMLEAVGTGVAMGNAIDEVKARADVICKSVEEDGVYHYCLEKKLIKC